MLAFPELSLKTDCSLTGRHRHIDSAVHFHDVWRCFCTSREDVAMPPHPLIFLLIKIRSKRVRNSHHGPLLQSEFFFIHSRIIYHFLHSKSVLILPRFFTSLCLSKRVTPCPGGEKDLGAKFTQFWYQRMLEYIKGWEVTVHQAYRCCFVVQRSI